MNNIRGAIVAALLVASSVHPTAQQQAAAQIPNTSGAVARAAVAPRTVASIRPNAVGTIQGNALSSSNGQMANTMVRLRDARFGRIVDSQLTDMSGIFTFKALDPGSYIVEMMANDQTILAASQVLNINAGEAVSAVVKLPFRLPPFAGVLGNATPTTAAAVASEAATSGVLTLTNVGDPTCAIEG